MPKPCDTQKKAQSVTMLVVNKPGVLSRLIGYIRHEGWNIKNLHVDETDDIFISKIEMTIEGSHTKLASVVDKLIYLDCVLQASVCKDGQVAVRTKPENAHAPDVLTRPQEKKEISKKRPGIFRILAINPGSTSTKIALYDNEEILINETIRHDRSTLDSMGSIIGQKEFRTAAVRQKLDEYGADVAGIDAIAGRGGLLRPIDSGVYIINDLMLNDLNSATASVHASALGAIIAGDISKKTGKPAFVVDPIVVDEMDRYAKLSGMPGIERTSVFHALNQKAIARRCAADIGKEYNNSRFVVAHLGGGITVGAHRYGRVIDVNDALAGEGPFTPERTGGIPAIPLIKMCFSGEYTEEEMITRITKNGGMQGYLGTNDLETAQRMINCGDEFTTLVVDSMAYQVCKEIGAMIAVLEGRADGVILTGGLAYSTRFTGSIKNRIDPIAPVYVYPGEDEMYSLMSGVLRVLKGEEPIAEYL